MSHKLFESRSRQSVNTEDGTKERSRERYERDRESGETDTDEETLEGSFFFKMNECTFMFFCHFTKHNNFIDLLVCFSRQ